MPGVCKGTNFEDLVDMIGVLYRLVGFVGSQMHLFEVEGRMQVWDFFEVLYASFLVTIDGGGAITDSYVEGGATTVV